MLRGFVVAIGIFFVFYALGFGVLQWRTHDTEFLAQKVKDHASQAAAPTGLTVTTDPEKLGGDLSLDSKGPPGGALDSTGPAQPTVVIDTDRQEAQANMQIWFAAVMAGGLVPALAWLIFAWRRASAVHGAMGMRSGASWWWGGVLLLAILGLVAAFYALDTRHLLDLISTTALNMMVIFSAIWVLIAYYLACAFGAPTVLRPSVPLATLIVPVRSAPR